MADLPKQRGVVGAAVSKKNNRQLNREPLSVKATMTATATRTAKKSNRFLDSSKTSTLHNVFLQLRHDYLIKYAYFVKCYFNRFASISDPEK